MKEYERRAQVTAQAHDPAPGVTALIIDSNGRINSPAQALRRELSAIESEQALLADTATRKRAELRSAESLERGIRSIVERRGS